jgi:uncharacterized protein involved in exopolysaccharide biosynthesis
MDKKPPFNNDETNEVEFSLLEMLQTIYSKRKKVITFLIFGLVFGFFYAFLFNPNEYKARAVILPISNPIETGTSGLLKQFGKLGGISLDGGSSSEGIPPGLYPNVVNSTPFLLYISNQKVSISELDSSILVYDYFDKHHSNGFGGFLRSWTIELPDKIMGLFRGTKEWNISENKRDIDSPIRLSKKQQSVLNTLNDRISVELDEDVGTVDVHVKMPDPILTAEIAVLTLNYLTEYSIAFKTDKLLANQEFIQGRFEEAQKRFYKAQEKLATFNDRNQNLTLARAQAEKERLEADYNLTFDLYNGLSQQLEESRIKVQEKTPAFKILEPVQIPLNKSSPRKLVIIFICSFFGLIFGLFWVLYGKYIKDFISQISLKNS